MSSDFKKGEDRDEKIDIFLDNLAWYFSSKPMGDWTANRIEKLNETLIEASKTSGKLSRSLNCLTGVIAIGSVVGVGWSILEFFLSR